VGVVLLSFVALVFALTVVKVTSGDRMHANDASTIMGTAPKTGTGTAP